ncbi:MAG: GAF domain-containing protein [Archaeoglobaceae archaeon]
MSTTSDDLEGIWEKTREQLLVRLRSILNDDNSIKKEELIERELETYLYKIEELVNQRASKLEESNEYLRQKLEEKQKVESRILFLDRVLRSLTAISHVITRVKSKDELLQSACDILTDVYEYRFVWIGIIEEGHKKVVPIAQSGFEEGYLDSIEVTWDDSPTGQGPTGTAIKTGKPSFMSDILNDPNFEPWRSPAMERGYNSSAAIPLIANNHTYGALCIYSSKTDAFDNEEVELLTQIAEDIAYALSSIEADERRKNAEEKVRQLFRQNRLILKSVGEGIYGVNLEGNATFVNPAALEITGFKPEELIGKHQHDILHHTRSDGSPYPRNECPVHNTMEDKTPRHVTSDVFWRKDGTSFPVEYTVTPIIESGKVMGAVVVFKDISERKKTQEEQKRLTQNLESLWEAAQMVDVGYEALCDHVLNKIVEMTQSEYAFYGFLNEDESVINVPSWSQKALKDCGVQNKPKEFPIPSSGVWSDVVSKRERVISNDYQNSSDKKGVPEGHIPLNRILVVPTFSSGKIVSVVAVANKHSDYTERDAKQVDAFMNNVQMLFDRMEMQEELQRLSTAVKMISDSIIITDKEGNILDINEATISTFGYGRDYFLGKKFSELVEPQDQKKAENALERVLDQGAIKQEYMVSENERRFIETKFSLMTDPVERVIGIVAVNREITEQKRSEEEVRKQLMKFHLREGELYLEMENTLSKSLEGFKDLLNVGYPGIVISRTPQEKLKADLERLNDYWWLARKDEGAIPPELGEIETRVENLSRAAFLIDRLDYLISNNDFESVLYFIQNLRELAYLKDHTIILSVDPQTLDERQARLLVKECSQIEPKHMTKLPDELLDVMKLIFRQNKSGIKPTYTDVGKELGISKPTARKRIRRLVNHGYLVEMTQGRFKLVETTEKGRALFST